MEKKWWHEKVAYQVYPKSFCDSNGDGIGDLRGIISKLDYLQDLGIEILWISPVYPSPCADQGYDISDYYGIDPQFGTMEDMEELLAEAKKRGIHVLMDLVVNHCSDEHEWFKKACADPDGEYGKYFYIEKMVDGKVPCNWRSYFGGSVWEPIPGTDRCYLHVFHKKQPDLNWENPKLREEIYRMMNWWLDKGLAGFRIDAIINIKKPLPWHDYPADREDGLCDMGQPLAEARGVQVFLQEMKEKTFGPHNAFSVGEVFNVKREELAAFIGEEGCFSSMFDFRQTLEGKSTAGWYDCTVPTPEDYKRCCFESQRESEGIGYLSNIIENHDEPRGVSHYLPEELQTEKGKKLLAAMYFMLKGLPFLYQGQELGMENMKFSSIDEIDDVSSQEEYRVCLEAGLTPEAALRIVNHYSRDNVRTPFHWNDRAHAGFSTGNPWLPVNPNYETIHVAAQMEDSESILSFYRSLIALRKNPEYKETIVYGRTEPVLEDEAGIMAYFRRREQQGEAQQDGESRNRGSQDILVAGNFTSEERHAALPELEGRHIRLLLDNYGSVAARTGAGEQGAETAAHRDAAEQKAGILYQKGILTLKPQQAVILVME